MLESLHAYSHALHELATEVQRLRIRLYIREQS
jgi:hypothetical protein